MKRKPPAWVMMLLDRLLYALALAIVGAVVGWFQGHGERKQLEKDVKNLEWGVEYFRE